MYVFINGVCFWFNFYFCKFIFDYVFDVIFYDSFEDFFNEFLEEFFQYLDGWEIGCNFVIFNNFKNGLINVYLFSDVLVCKDYFVRVVDFWWVKRFESKLFDYVFFIVRFLFDYVEYVDELFIVVDDLILLYLLEQNESCELIERDWWILKLVLIDCGVGI